MGMFKQFKDMKETLAAAPDMVEQAQQMQANAQNMAAAQQQAAAAAAANAATAGGTIPQEGPDFEPVGPVTIEIWAEVAKGLAAYNYDQSKAVEIAAEKGISAEDWEAGQTEWNARLQRNPAVGQRFNALYTGRA